MSLALPHSAQIFDDHHDRLNKETMTLELLAQESQILVLNGFELDFREAFAMVSVWLFIDINLMLGRVEILLRLATQEPAEELPVRFNH